MRDDYTQSHHARADWFAHDLTARSGLAILLCGVALTLLVVPLDFAILRTIGPYGGMGAWLKGDVLRELEFMQQFGAISSIVLIALVIWLLDPGRRVWIPRLALAMLAHGLLMHVLKVLISRPRPRVLLSGNALAGHDSPWTFPFAWNAYPLPRLAGDGTISHVLTRSFEFSQAFTADLWSMPSSHAGASACLAACLARLYPRIAPLVVGLAIVAGITRILLGAHYPSDVIAGWTLGFLVGKWVMGWKQRRSIES